MSHSHSARPVIPDKRRSSTLHYQTFPTYLHPPVSRGRPPSGSEDIPGTPSRHGSGSDEGETPLPKRQLIVLAIIALAEQTAFNSISPYLPDMVLSFPETKKPEDVGIYVGLIASSFALAQFGTNFFWGWLSDRIGRKPVVIAGTVFTAMSFLAFGFCRNLWQAILVQVFMGLGNGNQGVVSTCLGEITDRSNQSKAFTYLPVVYGIGAITGPAIGGLLVNTWNPFSKDGSSPYPYLLPNLFSAVILILDLTVILICMEESLEEAKKLPPLKRRLGNLFSWLWQFSSSSKPTYLRRVFSNKAARRNRREDEALLNDEQEEEQEDQDAVAGLFPNVAGEQLTAKEVMQRDTILLMITYFIFQLSNISFNSLYPIFGEARPPTGRALNPREIGLSLSFAGAFTILFQIGIYGQVRDRVGNRATYRLSLLTFVAAFLLIPWVGYKDKTGLFQGRNWVWFELGFVLVVKTIAAVGGLTSALLLITNSAPNHNVLGTLNGLAQTLSAAGRAVGPFVSGGLFAAGTRVKPKGEALVFGLFGGIAFLGFLLSFGIRNPDLEGDGFDSDDEHEHARSLQESSPEAS